MPVRCFLPTAAHGPLVDVCASLAQNLNSDLQFHRVGRQVNSSKYEEADCIEPINPL